MERFRTLARWALAALMIGAGIGHLLFTREFLAQTPSWLPSRETLVVASGFVEIGFGVALLAWRRRRREVGRLLAAYLVVVVVGNVYQLTEGTSLFALDTDAERWGRLLAQPVLVLWALWCTGAWPRGDPG
jgi:uncharacterized membrane protein